MTRGYTMKCSAAVIHGVNQDWAIEEIEVDQPKAGEVLVAWTHAGLCHNDEHLLTGDFIPSPEAMEAMDIDTIFPMIGGHQAGTLELDELITQTRSPDDNNVDYQDMRDGKNLRGMVVHAWVAQP